MYQAQPMSIAHWDLIRYKFDLILAVLLFLALILDIQLSYINGLEVLKRIRASNVGKDIPIIAMTSYAMSGDKEKLLAAGCTAYIEKPIDPMLVIGQIQEVLSKQSMS